MENNKINFEKVRKWTKGMAVYSTIMACFGVLGLLLTIPFGIGTHIVSIISAGIVWPTFYGFMAKIFYKFANELSQGNIVSTTPYTIWIGAQVVNVAWLFIVNLLNLWEVWFAGPIVTGLILSIIALVPLRTLKKN